MNYFACTFSLLALVCQPVVAQQSQKNAPTRIQGNTNIAVAAGNVSTVVVGRNKKACTNIGGIVSDECK